MDYTLARCCTLLILSGHAIIAVQTVLVNIATSTLRWMGSDDSSFRLLFFSMMCVSGTALPHIVMWVGVVPEIVDCEELGENALNITKSWSRPCSRLSGCVISSMTQVLRIL